MSNVADVVIFQTRRGRAAAGVSRDVTDYVAANGLTTYDVVDGSDTENTVSALFDSTTSGKTLFVERADEAVIPVYRAVAERLGLRVAAFAVAAAPRKRLPLVAVGSDDAALAHG
jgi:hypothetical protein